ncbi:MAG: MBL fold metallo-hydrolase [Myxococcota bacterium]
MRTAKGTGRARGAGLAGVVALVALLAGAPTAGGDRDAGAPVGEGPLHAPHRDEDGFFNPWKRFERPSVRDLLVWKLSRNPYDEARDPVVPRVPNDGAYLAGVEHSATVTWVGHATFAVHDRDDVFLTDPHFTKRALIPARAVPPGLPLESIPADAFAVVSHNHYDHLDAGTVEGLPASVGWYVPKGLADWFRSRGREDVTELDWWESARRGRFTITCLPSQHWSLRLGQGEGETLWCAWLVDSGDYRYFFAGDTGYFEGFAEYGRRFAPIDVAMLPIGAYAPRWFMAYQHMDPEQAYQAFLDLGARVMLPMHWGTFELTDEPLDRPPQELAETIARRRGVDDRVRVLAVGERWKIPVRPDSSKEN